MSLNPDTNDPRRANLIALRWDSAWIDPALRRMAEAAAQRSDLPVEEWMERAIRRACGMPAMVVRAPEIAEQPAPNFSTTLSTAKSNAARQPIERQARQSPARAAIQPQSPQPQPPARATIQPQEPRLAPEDSDEPLALTQPIDFPADRAMRRPVPPPPQGQARGMSVFWAAGVAAVLAFIAVIVVRDPNVIQDIRGYTTAYLQSGIAELQGRFASLQGGRATNPPPSLATKPPPALASKEGAPLRVSPNKSDRTVRLAIVPPAIETAANNPDKAAPAPASVATTVAVVPPTPVAIAPAPSTPPKQPVTTAMAPAAPPIAPSNPKPVQMAALPSQSPAMTPTDVPPEPLPTPVATNAPADRTPAVTPPATPTTVAPAQPETVAIAPKPVTTPPTVEIARAAPPAQAPAAPVTPSPAPTESTKQVAVAPPTQVAMAPTVAPAPPTPPVVAPADRQDGPGTALAADVRIATALEAKVKAGDHVAEYRLGILYALGKGVPRDYDEAAKLLLRSAESGLPEAQYDYGVLCDKGLGVPRDSAEAARWYAKAAQQGHPPAALNLGYAYAEGLGVTRNLPEAARWFRRAAEAGLINAQFNLAYMFEQGAGVTKSPADAYAWYSIAAEKGDQGAQQAMERIAGKMSPRELQLAKARIKTVKRSIRVQH